MQGVILKAVRQLRENPKHPGLHVHRLRGQAGVFGARVSQGDRLTFRWEGGTIVLLNHCNHSILKGR